MTRPEQQERERRHVRAMLELLSLTVDGNMEPGGRGEPDFSLRLVGGPQIALEETGAIDSARAKAWGHKGTKGDLERALLKAMQREGVTASVSGYLHVEALVDLGDDEDAANVLAARIAVLLRDAMREGREVSKSQLRRNGVEHVRFIRAQPAAQSSVALAVSAMPMGPELVQRAIDKKRDKLASYRTREAEQYWLLVVGGETISGFVGWGVVEGHTFASPFDRTVFLDEKDRVCVDLACTGS